jgi:hypothetical protein
MPGNNAREDPSETDAEAGIVVVDGPGAVAISLTPDAAEETGKRLQGSASKARDQKAGRRPPFD